MLEGQCWWLRDEATFVPRTVPLSPQACFSQTQHRGLWFYVPSHVNPAAQAHCHRPPAVGHVPGKGGGHESYHVLWATRPG